MPPIPIIKYFTGQCSAVQCNIVQQSRKVRQSPVLSDDDLSSLFPVPWEFPKWIELFKLFSFPSCRAAPAPLPLHHPFRRTFLSPCNVAHFKFYDIVGQYVAPCGCIYLFSKLPLCRATSPLIHNDRLFYDPALQQHEAKVVFISRALEIPIDSIGEGEDRPVMHLKGCFISLTPLI